MSQTHPSITSHPEWHACPSATFIGVDGARGGWVAARYLSGFLSLDLYSSLVELVVPENSRILIDMPIGLPTRGKRRCDTEARALLGPRGSTIFTVPSRRAVYSPSYVECCETNLVDQGCRVSKQAWNLTPKIRELDVYLQTDLSKHSYMAEAHPELAFKTLSSVWPIPSKHSAEGRAVRNAILTSTLATSLTPIVENFLSTHRGDATATDAYDALSLCALLAFTQGQVRFVGDATLDAHGAPQRICAGRT